MRVTVGQLEEAIKEPETGLSQAQIETAARRRFDRHYKTAMDDVHPRLLEICRYEIVEAAQDIVHADERLLDADDVDTIERLIDYIEHEDEKYIGAFVDRAARVRLAATIGKRS